METETARSPVSLRKGGAGGGAGADGRYQHSWRFALVFPSKGKILAQANQLCYRVGFAKRGRFAPRKP
ncbi:unnamed protein product [Arctia plantaginis]|uniref:Uncharacterized protein n=1 Tax=Arctia plantaginis TaxID=874455 RepID=A0A8S1BJS7_ARCPL|nr:unnamed protein product [Arctia plantaginis]